MRNAVAGHSIGLGAGLASLWITGSWHVADTFMFHASTLPHAFAAAVAVALTLGILTVTDLHHAPAASTTVLVATGLAQPWRLFLGLVVGLAALFLLALALNSVMPAPAAWERNMGGQPAHRGARGPEHESRRR